jgi:hypothetical protein
VSLNFSKRAVSFFEEVARALPRAAARDEDIWNWYTRGFGPLRQLVEERFKEDIDAYHRHYAVPADLHVKREYLLTIGRRR